MSDKKTFEGDNAHPGSATATSPSPTSRRPTRTPKSRRHQRYESGVRAAIYALAPSFVLTAFLGVPTPLEPLAEFIMLATPVSLAAVLLNLLGPIARTAGLLGALACCMPIGGLIALVSPDDAITRSTSDGSVKPQWRNVRLLHWAAAACLALLVTFPLVRATTYAGEAIAALLTGLLFTPILWYMRYRSRMSALDQSFIAEDEPTTMSPAQSRRSFLRAALQTGANTALLLSMSSYDLWSSGVSTLLDRTGSLRTLFHFTPPPPRVAGFPVIGEEPEVTPIQKFYLMSKNNVDPVVDTSSWLLRIDGAVHQPLTLTYGELLALPRLNEYVTLRCVSNPVNGRLMSTAYWSGVSLSALLQRAGVRSNAVAIMFHAPDGFDEIVPLAASRHPMALLAYGMNGETLPQRHGGPARALIPGYFGFKNVKWVQGMTVLSHVEPGYWEQRGWHAGPIHSVARIDLARRDADEWLVAGVAFGGLSGVGSVQVQVDNDPWQTAQLNAPALSSMSWVQWQIRLPLSPGERRLAARVIDSAGRAQDATSAPIYPNGATGLDTLRLTV